MEVYTPISETEMLRSWGESEAETLVRERFVGAEVLRRRNAHALTEQDFLSLVTAIRQWREPLLCGVIDQNATWQTAKASAADLARVRVINGWDCPDVKTIPELLRRHPEYAFDRFDESRAFGLPVLIGAGDGDWCKMDGTHRCLTVFRDRLSTRVILGIWPGAKSWPWWPR